MVTIYRLETDELDEAFLAALKTLYQGKKIEIIVEELDETVYLLRTAANRQRLLQAIENAEDEKNLLEFSLSEEL